MTRRPSAFLSKTKSNRPTKPVRPKSGYPALNFAITYNMLSDEEIADCHSGIMSIKDHFLKSEFGYESALYPGRKYDLLADKLLGLDKPD